MTGDFPHLLMLNSTIYTMAPAFIFPIRAIDVTFHLCCLVLAPFSCLAVIRAGVFHRNFRLQICLANLYFVIGIVSRFVILYYELTDRPVDENDNILFAAEVTRTFCLDYFCTIVYALSIERLVATKLWSWYEKGSRSTLLVLIGVELFILVPDITLPLLSRIGVISHLYVFLFQFGAWTTSILIFYCIYCANVSISREMGRGAVLGAYSVSKSFQVRENIEVFEYMFKMIRAAAVAGVPAFVCFAIKQYLPFDWPLFRLVVWAAFDVFTASFGLAYLVISIHYNRRIYKEFLNIGVISFIANHLEINKLPRIHPKTGVLDEGDLYFSMLDVSWDKCARTRPPLLPVRAYFCRPAQYRRNNRGLAVEMDEAEEERVNLHGQVRDQEARKEAEVGPAPLSKMVDVKTRAAPMDIDRPTISGRPKSRKAKIIASNAMLPDDQYAAPAPKKAKASRSHLNTFQYPLQPNPSNEAHNQDDMSGLLEGCDRIFEEEHVALYFLCSGQYLFEKLQVVLAQNWAFNEGDVVTVEYQPDPNDVHEFPHRNNHYAAIALGRGKCEKTLSQKILHHYKARIEEEAVEAATATGERTPYEEKEEKEEGMDAWSVHVDGIIYGDFDFLVPPESLEVAHSVVVAAEHNYSHFYEYS